MMRWFGRRICWLKDIEDGATLLEEKREATVMEEMQRVGLTEDERDRIG